MKADNTSSLVVLIDPLGPRKLSILRKKREENFKRIEEVKEQTEQESKVSTRTSPRKPSDGSIGIPRTITPSIVPDHSIIAGYNATMSDSDSVQLDNIKCRMPIKSAASPVSVDLKPPYSLPSPMATGDLDDSIQAHSVHKKLSFNPIPHDSACNSEIKAPTSNSVLAHCKSSISSDSKPPVSHLSKSVFKKSTPYTRTRQRHASNPSGPIAKPPAMPTRNTPCGKDASASHLPTSSCDISRTKRAVSMPVLTDNRNHRPSSNSKVNAANLNSVSKSIISRDSCQSAKLHKICHGSEDLRVKSSSEMNIKLDLRSQVKGHSSNSANRINTNNNALNKAKHSTIVRKVVKPRSGLRMKSTPFKRSVRQMENKLITKKQTVGLKRKLNSSVDETMSISKRLCTR